MKVYTITYSYELPLSVLVVGASNRKKKEKKKQTKKKMRTKICVHGRKSIQREKILLSKN